MEVFQEGKLLVSNIGDTKKFLAYAKDGIFFGKYLGDEISDSVSIEFMDVPVNFEYVVSTVDDMIRNFSDITIEIEAEQITTYEGFKYKIEYKDQKVEIWKSDDFTTCDFENDEYEDFVEVCEDSSIEDIIDEDEFVRLNEKNNHWYFIEEDCAKNTIEQYYSVLSMTLDQILNQ